MRNTSNLIIMAKSVSAAWLWFLSLFIVIFSFLATGVYLNNQKTKLKLKHYQDSLKTYEQLYTNIKQDYVVLNNKYQLALRSALQGSKVISEKQQQLIKLQQVLRKQDSILRSVRDNVQKALTGYTNSQLSVKMKNGKLYVTMHEVLLFPFGSAQVQRSGIKALGKLARVLRKNPNLNIIIEGHTDNIPIKSGQKCWKDNWDLSAARAISVARILINKYNIAPERIEVAGKAQYDPVMPNITAKGRAMNRRIEIIVTPKLDELYKLIQQ